MLRFIAAQPVINKLLLGGFRTNFVKVYHNLWILNGQSVARFRTNFVKVYLPGPQGENGQSA